MKENNFWKRNWRGPRGFSNYPQSSWITAPLNRKGSCAVSRQQQWRNWHGTCLSINPNPRTSLHLCLSLSLPAGTCHTGLFNNTDILSKARFRKAPCYTHVTTKVLLVVYSRSWYLIRTLLIHMDDMMHPLKSNATQPPWRSALFYYFLLRKD